MVRRSLDKLHGFIVRNGLAIALVLGALLIVMRLHWALRVLALVIFILAAIVFLVGAAVAIYDAIFVVDETPAFQKKLQRLADNARERLRVLLTERSEIEQRLETLCELDTQETGGSARRSALLQGFERELKLRESKIAFYRQSINRLQEVEHRWSQEKALLTMQQDLKRLRAADPVDRQQIEQLRSELRYEKELLDNYQTLSRRMEAQQTPEGARTVEQELKLFLDRD